MKRLLALGVVLGLAALMLRSLAADTSENKSEQTKEALRELQDFIGGWKGNGGPDKIGRPSPRDEVWSEKVEWSWRFKGDDVWLSMTVKDGKHIKVCELRYLPSKKRYQLTATGKGDKKQVFEGKLKDEMLIFDRVNPDTKASEQIRMNVAAEGVRFIYRFAHKDEGSTVWKKDYVVACTREGESLGRQETKNICVVSGGAGKMTVSYNGETFYVCCSGCADAFKENPEKYIKEFKAKQGKK